MNLFGETLVTDTGFQELVADILAEIRRRFDWVQEGTFRIGTDEWPVAWQYESEGLGGFFLPRSYGFPAIIGDSGAGC